MGPRPGIRVPGGQHCPCCGSLSQKVSRAQRAQNTKEPSYWPIFISSVKTNLSSVAWECTLVIAVLGWFTAKHCREFKTSLRNGSSARPVGSRGNTAGLCLKSPSKARLLTANQHQGAPGTSACGSIVQPSVDNSGQSQTAAHRAPTPCGAHSQSSFPQLLRPSRWSWQSRPLTW